MCSVGDEQIVVFFEVDGYNAIEGRQDREGRHLQSSRRMARQVQDGRAQASVTQRAGYAACSHEHVRQVSTCGKTDPYIHHSEENGSLKL